MDETIKDMMKWVENGPGTNRSVAIDLEGKAVFLRAALTNGDRLLTVTKALSHVAVRQSKLEPCYQMAWDSMKLELKEAVERNNR